MQVIIGLPGAIAIIYLLFRTPAQAFIHVYLPVLLLLPNYYRWEIPGLPDPTCVEAAVVPIAIVAVIKRSGAYRFSITDVALMLYVGVCAFSEYQAKGYADAQNFLFDLMATCMAPYFLTKLLIEPEGLRVPFAKKFVAFLAFVAFLGPYELRMGNHPLIIPWERMFPDRLVWGEQFRYGLARTKLTFGGSILAATIYAVACQIQFWLLKSNQWGPKERLFPGMPFRLPGLPLTAAAASTLGILAGSVMPDSRGPLLGAIAGFVLVLIGQSANIRKSFAIWTPVVLIVAIAGGMALQSYASVSRSDAATAEQETAAYRHDLLIHYIGIVQEKPLLGWGIHNFPVIEGQWSIDNEYLFLALEHGVFGLAAFVLVLLLSLGRLFARCVFNEKLALPDRRFALAIAGGIIAISISVLSVYVGEQVYLVLFIILGWGEGCVMYQSPGKREHITLKSTTRLEPAHPFRYVVQ